MLRLSAFGSLATVKNVFEFDGVGEDLELIEQISNEKTRSYFFKVSFEIDILMREVIEEIGRNNFLFYWVDALFVSGFAKNKVVDFLNEKGFGVTCKKMLNVHVSSGGTGESKKIVTTELLKAYDDFYEIDMKPFFIPPKNKEIQKEFFVRMINNSIKDLKF